MVEFVSLVLQLFELLAVGFHGLFCGTVFEGGEGSDQSVIDVVLLVDDADNILELSFAFVIPNLLEGSEILVKEGSFGGSQLPYIGGPTAKIQILHQKLCLGFAASLYLMIQMLSFAMFIDSLPSFRQSPHSKLPTEPTKYLQRLLQVLSAMFELQEGVVEHCLLVGLLHLVNRVENLQFPYQTVLSFNKLFPPLREYLGFTAKGMVSNQQGLQSVVLGCWGEQISEPRHRLLLNIDQVALACLEGSEKYLPEHHIRRHSHPHLQ